MSVGKLLKLSIVFAVMLAAGCNTLHGVGKDIEKVGEAIQKS